MTAAMSPARFVTGTALLLVALVLTAAVPSACAHTSGGMEPTVLAVASLDGAAPSAPSVEVVAADSASVGPPAWLAFGILGLVALLLKMPRRVAATAFVVLLAVLAFETGVHAVHHLGNTHAASHCAVASVAPHLGGAADGVPVEVPHLHVTTDRVVVADALVLRHPSLRPSPGRAPPALAS
jgi:hypothetical protein